ncbi:hypothetical protein BGP83_24950 [Pseudomonas putida]|nr:hypothetical protein BGP83_24950 [Pseudomonas putida]
MFGGGHYRTVKAHCDRWQAFVRWCRSEQGPGINDARQIDRKVLADYAALRREVVTASLLKTTSNAVFERERETAHDPVR